MKLLTSRNIIPYQEICVIAITTFKIVRISIIMKIQVPPLACIRIKGEKLMCTPKFGLINNSDSMSSVLYRAHVV